MSTQILQSTYKAHYIIILWGDKFDEDVATIFTTEARRVGLCVKVVGVTGVQAAGGNGLVLSADLTLSQAMLLADNAICVVVPCSAAVLQRVENDPRLADFFQRADANHALFVVSHSDAIERSSLKELDGSQSQFSIYRNYENLIESTQGIIRQLSTAAASA